MKPIKLFAFAATLGLASAAALWLRHPLPADTAYFHWEKRAEGYALEVSHVAGNPQFRDGVTTVAPRSGPVQVIGRPGTAEPGALVEVSNARTREGFQATARPDGAFEVRAEAQRGDTLKILSRRVRFLRPGPAQLVSQPAVVAQPSSSELSSP